MRTGMTTAIGFIAVALFIAPFALPAFAQSGKQTRPIKALASQTLTVGADEASSSARDGYSITRPAPSGLQPYAQTTAVGQVNGQNWARPTGGYIISGFGMRLDPITKAIWGFHGGVDITGRGCGAPIFAAHAGRVTYSGRYGDLGNYIQIDHGDGTSTGYGHIVDGGLLVARGQDVTSGQQIARVGTTGASTGCHLHFITRINGQLVDPVPFMRARGVSLG